jgi:hypothetical protein
MSKPQSIRKPHNQDAGYVASRKNALTGQANVIYVAAEQGIDVGEMKYAVVCDAHAAFEGETSIPRARVLMKDAAEFCLECRKLAGDG